MAQSAAPSSEVPVAPRLTALDAPRWIASAHVVGFHYYSKTLAYFLSGGLWTQYFFIMGGFLLAYVEMVKPPSKRPALSQFQYLQKRLVTIYPLYLFSLVAILTTAAQRSSFAWSTLPLHILLLQAILPICATPSPTSECSSYGFNNVAWFISCLIVYWLLLRPLSRLFERFSLRACYLWLFGLWIFSLVPASLDLAVPMPYSTYIHNAIQAGPLGYFHVFAAGVVLARVFLLTAMVDVSTRAPPREGFETLTLSTETVPCIYKFGCVLGYGLWAVVASLFWLLGLNGHSHTPVVAWVYRVLHNGGVFPLMALILLGGSVGADPLAKFVFQNSVFRALGRLSYAQYLLQIPVSIILAVYLDPQSARAQARLPNSPTTPAFLLWFPVVLLTCAFLAQRYIESPYSEWLRKKMKAQEGKPELLERLAGRVCECWTSARGRFGESPQKFGEMSGSETGSEISSEEFGGGGSRDASVDGTGAV